MWTIEKTHDDMWQPDIDEDVKEDQPSASEQAQYAADNEVHKTCLGWFVTAMHMELCAKAAKVVALGAIDIHKGLAGVSHSMLTRAQKKQRAEHSDA